MLRPRQTARLAPRSWAKKIASRMNLRRTQSDNTLSGRRVLVPMSLPQLFTADDARKLAYAIAEVQLQSRAAKIRRMLVALAPRIGVLAPIAWVVLLGSLLYQLGLVAFG